MPLAEKIRPASLDDFVGQRHLVGEGAVLRGIIESGTVINMLFCGSSGTGKTTLANIIAERSGMTLRRLNATQASTADIKQIIAETNTLIGRQGILLYLDEIQYFNKKQQQSLLEFIENGDITLIASTTENPYFYVYGAILSRCTVFEFKPVTYDEIIPAIRRGFELSGIEDTGDEVMQTIARGSGGDVRKALGAVEICALTAKGGKVSVETAKEAAQKSALRYDRAGDEHYEILSAFQKAIRAGDENTALYNLARLLAAGDLPSACRRLLVIAAEDIGLAFPNAAAIVKACVDSALQLGLPEARIPLSQAVILLATSPKSTTACEAISRAMADVEQGRTQGVYYEFGSNKMEQVALEYRNRIKGD